MDWRPDGAAPPVPVAAAPVVPVDFTVVKRRLGGGGDMEVRDASGGLAFRFVAAGGGGGGGRALLDAAGGVLVTVRSGEVMVCVCLFFFGFILEMDRNIGCLVLLQDCIMDRLIWFLGPNFFVSAPYIY